LVNGALNQAVFAWCSGRSLLDKLSLIQVNLPEDVGTVEPEGAEVVLTVGVIVLGEVVEAADGAHGALHERAPAHGYASRNDELAGVAGGSQGIVKFTDARGLFELAVLRVAQAGVKSGG
jgi:hypothetical protein